jgi:PAS domain S-box-containing protein
MSNGSRQRSIVKHSPANILMVDDQPAKLLGYEVILRSLGENIIKANSASEVFEHLLNTDIAVLLIDVCMPRLDGVQLASMIREHPRFQKTAIIFISAIHLTGDDLVRGYEMGAVDYVPVPVVPAVLRAKVRVFVELYRKTKQLEALNQELETRVRDRMVELESAVARLRESDQLRSLALAAGQMGSWNWDILNGKYVCDEGQCRIFGIKPECFELSTDNVRTLVYPDDGDRVEHALRNIAKTGQPHQAEFRVRRPNGELRWCIGTAAASLDTAGRVVRMSGVTIDITDRRLAEERQELLTREVDHRAKNALAVVQSIVRLTRATTIENYVEAVEGRIFALARAHLLLSESRWRGADLGRLVTEELAPYRTHETDKIARKGPDVTLEPATAQAVAVALHELSTNAAKYGALSVKSGRVALSWELRTGTLVLKWVESGGPPVKAPASHGYGSKVIRAVIERQLGGRAILDWRPEGLRCILLVPRRNAGPALEGFLKGRSSAEEQVTSLEPIIVAGNKVLLAEDEGVLALMMRDTLVEQGFSVVGPFAKTREAIAAARDGQVHAAVLDINLDGEMTYPLADVLNGRGVPFVFVSGYEADSIDVRFSRIPVLRKPIERHALQNAFVFGQNGPNCSASSDRTSKQ